MYTTKAYIYIKKNAFEISTLEAGVDFAFFEQDFVRDVDLGRLVSMKQVIQTIRKEPTL